MRMRVVGVYSARERDRRATTDTITCTHHQTQTRTDHNRHTLNFLLGYCDVGIYIRTEPSGDLSYVAHRTLPYPTRQTLIRYPPAISINNRQQS